MAQEQGLHSVCLKVVEWSVLAVTTVGRSEGLSVRREVERATRHPMHIALAQFGTAAVLVVGADYAESCSASRQ